MKREKNSPFYLAIATEKASLEVTLHSSSNRLGQKSLYNFFHNLESKFALYCDGHSK
jgi:hypothetical protein